MDVLKKIQNPQVGRLVLEDGTVFRGISFGAKRSLSGEVVFNTGMVGYPEALTDPSYRGQILTLTYPLVGNYGVPDEAVKDEFGLPKYFESDIIHVQALIVSSYSDEPSHWNSKMSLGDWLVKHDVPALYGIDTRALTKKIREEGAMLGRILFGEDTVESVPMSDPNSRNLVAEVSRKLPTVFGSGKIRVMAIDCGIKNNIIRYLARNPEVTLTVVPWNYDIAAHEDEFDGLLISNGPGNPAMVSSTIDQIRRQLNRNPAVPIFGICLGNQLLALAAGAKTFKMKFGNRGMNQPCIDLRTTRCYITPQNHGYAVDENSLPENWVPFFRNANDNTNEGIIHRFLPFSSVQFHPEAQGGPTDTAFLFANFLSLIQDKRSMVTTVQQPVTDTFEQIRKVLLLGSGGLSIGQAGEFDYSGSQAIKALQEERIHVVLINPNIATVQTSAGMADEVYFLPVTPDFVEDVIQKEKPDGILLQFGGQTALNCGIQLHDSGVLKRHNVRVLGTPVETIRMTEDRELFAKLLSEIDERVAPSDTATNLEDAVKVATKLGYPVLVRAAFALGGLGSGFASNESELRKIVVQAFTASSQVIIDKSLRGWKEVEYEVVRDAYDNCITVCNMENFDPLGIHTGDSIVVAPSQTLSNDEYYRLRRTAIKVVRKLGVVGECNIQYALDPYSTDYCIIEVNARLSRSSALASKATGYPLAYVAAKLSLPRRRLTDLPNSVTRSTTACFEPALDYCVVKMPRWDLSKFCRVSSSIGSAMKSVGEVMAIGRTFEETFQKGLRMLYGSLDGFTDPSATFASNDTLDAPKVDYVGVQEAELEKLLGFPSDQRVIHLAAALRKGFSVERIYQITRIDRWFLSKLSSMFKLEEELSQYHGKLWDVPRDMVLNAKQSGFSDAALARILGSSAIHVRKQRTQLAVIPVVKQIDTLAAEFPAHTNYLYMTYSGTEHDLTFDENGIVVLGSGAYRIGSSCEFDWCAVECLRALRGAGRRSVMINFNPETVSTDYDECDRLYFEELSLERVLDIYETERASGLVVSVGGQIPQNMAVPLYKAGVRVLGTHPHNIDSAEDRFKFSELLDGLHVDQPEWRELTTVEDALRFAQIVGYPVLVRPSYVLSGAAMNVAMCDADLVEFLSQATTIVSSDAPVVCSKFITGAKEIEFDGVASNGTLLNFAISEHVENAGVHSGDATLILPAQKLYVETLRLVKRSARKIASALQITGPFNIQFLSKNNDIKVIECNLRASRSFPFVSKTLNINLVEQATRAMIGLPVKAMTLDLQAIDYVCIKAPMFSFTRLEGADPALRVEMASTGEVASFGDDRYEAFLKALLSTGFKMPRRNILISAGPLESKLEFLESAATLVRLGFVLYATPGTAAFFNENDIKCTVLHKPSSKQAPAIVDYIRERRIDLVINVPEAMNRQEATDGYQIRRAAVDFSVSLITNIKCAVLFTTAIARVKKFAIKSWREYLREGLRS
jgi:carbamoyl-phosphate synthase/aspartate carbamoyltransferase